MFVFVNKHGSWHFGDDSGIAGFNNLEYLRDRLQEQLGIKPDSGEGFQLRFELVTDVTNRLPTRQEVLAAANEGFRERWTFLTTRFGPEQYPPAIVYPEIIDFVCKKLGTDHYGWGYSCRFEVIYNVGTRKGLKRSGHIDEYVNSDTLVTFSGKKRSYDYLLEALIVYFLGMAGRMAHAPMVEPFAYYGCIQTWNMLNDTSSVGLAIPA